MIRTLAVLLLLTAGAVQAEEDAAQVVAALGLREGAAPVRDLKGWTKPKKIVVLSDGPARTAWFQEAAKGVTIVPVRGPQDAKAAIADADALVGFCQADVIAAGAKLKWVHTQQAGIENCAKIPKIGDGAIVLTNAQRLNGPNIAEHSMGLILALTRGINGAIRNQADGNWNPAASANVMDLEGKTMLIAGLGGIGTDVAKRADAFGMRVIATRNSGRDGPPFVAKVGLSSELPDMIGEADVVVNALPLTAETTGLFNAAMFARMKPTAYFVNIGRGQTVVTADLIKALEAKTIAGAGLDVTDPEPLPKDSALWKFPNVVITPHTAGASELKQERSWIVMRENLRRYVAGDKLYSVVDIKRGY
ncbi:MAG: D-2-hydroxyacid dehydrogenase [Rhodospirillaceae bacterium]|nr:D-2-hydroxyacid dehydrogenase [Rhodospirillaceae bacterium]